MHLPCADSPGAQGTHASGGCVASSGACREVINMIENSLGQVTGGWRNGHRTSAAHALSCPHESIAAVRNAVPQLLAGNMCFSLA